MPKFTSAQEPRPDGAREFGFTLLELMIVIAVIAIITSLLIPALLNTMEKANQRATMADMRTLGNALLHWELEHAPAAASSDEDKPIDMANLRSMLVPEYLEHLRGADAWKRPLRVLRGGSGVDDHRFLIWSAGKDGQFEEWNDGPFETTDFDKDIVWADGGFLTWPESLSEDTPDEQS